MPSQTYSRNDQDTVGWYDHEKDMSSRPSKGKLRIMPLSDSPWAPTGFGTNTKNIGCILHKEGHHIGYAGCQNPQHGKWHTHWPLGQTETNAWFELLPMMHLGQEKFGEKSFDTWVNNFRPDIILGHLDFQMFKHVTDRKSPTMVTMPIRDERTHKLLTRKQRMDMLNQIYKKANQGTPWKFGCIIPYDGEPSIPFWQKQMDEIDYPVAMSRYGQIGLKKDFGVDCDYIPHGVDTGLFKPTLNPKYGKMEKPDAFIVGCVARNQHRKNLPRLIKGFAQFVKKNNLSPDEVKLIMHCDWNDVMGWKIEEFAQQYGVDKYLMPPLMGMLDRGEAATEEEMANMYNCMDVFILPTGGEGFGIPTLEAMSCGVPICVTNYTTSYELIKCEDASKEDIPMFPLGGHYEDCGPNGRDHLEPDDICERGILIPYKDMWWDTPNRAAPQRAIASENAMCEAIQYYYDNPAKKLAAGKAARKHALDFYSWDVIGQKWIDWVNKITEEIK
jgi:glycosyltransferase involved in cell wall biosynthesis